MAVSERGLRRFPSNHLIPSLVFAVAYALPAVTELVRYLLGYVVRWEYLAFITVFLAVTHGVELIWRWYGVRPQHFHWRHGWHRYGVPLAAITALEGKNKRFVVLHYVQNDKLQQQQIYPEAAQDLLAEIRKYQPLVEWR